ncbi:hypothetical protein FOA52_014775 [Chlamydomonas sp. UWO 241]|nr:hypothetical protein FOA52_014775 [Chlamydomonas sp. UWO 241]
MCGTAPSPRPPPGGWLVDYGWWTTAGGLRLVDYGWWTTAGGLRLVDYGWNGCLNMVFSSAMNKRSVDGTMECYFCPTGFHEGDWERVTVLLCPTPSADGATLAAALFFAHTFDSLYRGGV